MLTDGAGCDDVLVVEFEEDGLGEGAGAEVIASFDDEFIGQTVFEAAYEEGRERRVIPERHSRTLWPPEHSVQLHLVSVLERRIPLDTNSAGVAVRLHSNVQWRSRNAF